jgi:hypothetical protein
MACALELFSVQNDRRGCHTLDNRDEDASEQPGGNRREKNALKQGLKELVTGESVGMPRIMCGIMQRFGTGKPAPSDQHDPQKNRREHRIERASTFSSADRKPFSRLS